MKISWKQFFNYKSYLKCLDKKFLMIAYNQSYTMDRIIETLFKLIKTKSDFIDGVILKIQKYKNLSKLDKQILLLKYKKRYKTEQIIETLKINNARALFRKLKRLNQI